MPGEKVLTRIPVIVLRILSVKLLRPTKSKTNNRSKITKQVSEKELNTKLILTVILRWSLNRWKSGTRNKTGRKRMLRQTIYPSTSSFKPRNDRSWGSAKADNFWFHRTLSLYSANLRSKIPRRIRKLRRIRRIN